MHFMICIEDPNSDAPVFEGPRDQRVWSLFADDQPGYFWGDWEMTRYATDRTYPEAVELAERLGLAVLAQIGLAARKAQEV